MHRTRGVDDKNQFARHCRNRSGSFVGWQQHDEQVRPSTQRFRKNRGPRHRVLYRTPGQFDIVIHRRVRIPETDPVPPGFLADIDRVIAAGDQFQG